VPGLAHGGSYPRPSYEVYSHSGLNFYSRSGLVFWVDGTEVLDSKVRRRLGWWRWWGSDGEDVAKQNNPQQREREREVEETSGGIRM